MINKIPQIYGTDWSKYATNHTVYGTDADGNLQTVLSVSGKGYLDSVMARVTSNYSTSNKDLYIKITVDGTVWLYFGIKNTTNTTDEPIIGVLPLSYCNSPDSSLNIAVPVSDGTQIFYDVDDSFDMLSSLVTAGTLFSSSGIANKIVPLSNKVFFNSGLIIEVKSTFGTYPINTIVNYALFI